LIALIFSSEIVGQFYFSTMQPDCITCVFDMLPLFMYTLMTLHPDKLKPGITNKRRLTAVDTIPPNVPLLCYYTGSITYTTHP